MMKLWQLSVWQLEKVPEILTNKSTMLSLCEEKVEDILLVGENSREALNQYYRDLQRNNIEIKTLCNVVWQLNNKYVYLSIEPVESIKYLNLDSEDEFFHIKVLSQQDLDDLKEKTPSKKEEELVEMWDGDPFKVTQKLIEDLSKEV